MKSKSSKKTSSDTPAGVHPLPSVFSKVLGECDEALEKIADLRAEELKLGIFLEGDGLCAREKRIRDSSNEIIRLVYECECRWHEEKFTETCNGSYKVGFIFGRMSEFLEMSKSRSLGAAKTIELVRRKTAAFVRKALEIAPSLQKGGRRPTKKEVWHATADTLPAAERIEYSAFCAHFTFTAVK